MNASQMLSRSVLVAAHPDDEILWFSSIVDQVDEVIFCFLACNSNQEWTNGRRQTLSEYPLRNVSCLGIDESEVFHFENWRDPVMTAYGMRILNNKISPISNERISDRRYVENFDTLKAELRQKLGNSENVVTHNPWGEYGSEEHVQVYRAVKDLQKELGFSLWFSNYCSNRSFDVTLEYISGYDSDYITLPTNKPLANSIMELYKKNDSWTWFADWEWFHEESFMKDKPVDGDRKKVGHILPLNMIKVRYTGKPEKSENSILNILKRKVVGREKKTS
jgi:LmbE family N-acetylglucosaminyl deacetylase